MARNTSLIERFRTGLLPARPTRLLKVPGVRQLAKAQLAFAQDAARRLGPPSAVNPAYVNWLVKESMLNTAVKQARGFVAKGSMWQNPFGRSQPRLATAVSSVWFTAYPSSTITRADESIVASLGDQWLWRTFQQIGITGMHTGPMKLAGGISGWSLTPSVDGHFDRISNKIDDLFGTDEEFRELAATAASRGGIIIDDLIPGHTGKGYDFQLAMMNYQIYPGIYHMIEIDPDDWHLLPKIPPGRDSVNLKRDIEKKLKERGYIIGKLERVLFSRPGVKDTNWSATKEVRGTDNIKRRWVYLHYWKDGQPTINWLDPTFAGMQLVVGDAIHSLANFGSRGLRLDANGLLGLEIGEENGTAWSEGHPLSEAANQIISGMVRKMGGFTFQELNLSLENIKAMSDHEADLSYDFVTRPAYHHALATGDTEFLRLMMRLGVEYEIDPGSLVHALQNHDELTLELVHFDGQHAKDKFDFRGKKINGAQLRKTIREEMFAAITEGVRYNFPAYGRLGVSCTTASLIAAVLKVRDLNSITPEEANEIKRAHLLLVMFNALQPGVFALSGWDLVGALTLDPKTIQDLVEEGDTRWTNRGAYDLMGHNPVATESPAGLPVARNLYGTLPAQLADETSFANQLKRILTVREECKLSTSTQIEVPDVTHPGLLVMIHQLEQPKRKQVTVLNFSAKPIKETFHSDHLAVGSGVTEMISGQKMGRIGSRHSFTVSLEPHQGLSLLVME